MRVFNTDYPVQQPINGDFSGRGIITIVCAVGTTLRIHNAEVNMAGGAAPYGINIVQDALGADYESYNLANGSYPGVNHVLPTDTDGLTTIDVYNATGSGTFDGAFEFLVEMDIGGGVYVPLNDGLVTSITLSNTGGENFLSIDVPSPPPYDYLGEAGDRISFSEAFDLIPAALIEDAISFTESTDLSDIELTLLITQRAAMTDSTFQFPAYRIHDRFSMAGNVDTTSEVTKTAASKVAFMDDASAVVHMLILEGVAFGDTLAATYTQIARVIQRLVLTGQATHYAEALKLVVDALVTGQLAFAMHKGELSDAIALNEAAAGHFTLIVQLLERLLLQGSATPAYTLTALVQDTLVLSTDLSNQAEAFALLRDAVSFAVTLSFDNGEYIAWVLNTESKGLSRYTNYPFNSFFKLGNEYYGVASDGCYALEGPDDDGVGIAAKFRLGMSNFGTRRLKRLPEVYYSIATNGTMYFKVILVDEVTGDKAVAIYESVPHAANAQREMRQKFGKGLIAVDFDIEIANVDGADFNIQALEFRPLVVDRRTRG